MSPPVNSKERRIVESMAMVMHAHFARRMHVKGSNRRRWEDLPAEVRKEFIAEALAAYEVVMEMSVL